MVHVPTATIVTVEPDTVQTVVVVELNVTARPEEAVALTLNAGSPYVLPASAPNVIVWLALPTGVRVKFWVGFVVFETARSANASANPEAETLIRTVPEFPEKFTEKVYAPVASVVALAALL